VFKPDNNTAKRWNRQGFRSLTKFLPVLAKDDGFIRHDRRDGHGYPGGVDKVLPMHIL